MSQGSFDDLMGKRPPCSNDTTSREAAESIAPKTHSLRAMVYQTLTLWGGKTCDELCEMLDIEGNTMRPRIRELVIAGLVEDSGETRPSSSGRKAIVWRVRA